MAAEKAAWEIVEAAFVAGAKTAAELPPQVGMEIAFAGRSNVGKSSLMNALMGRRRLVRTSSTPGCTRQISFYAVKSRDGAVLQLADLPGYGYAKRSKVERASWAELIEYYLAQREQLRAVLLLVDARRGLGEDELRLIEFVQARKPAPAVVLVATKIDKIAKSKRRAALSKLLAATKGSAPKGTTVLGVSALEGDGIEALWKALRRETFGAPVQAAEPSGETVAGATGETRAESAGEPGDAPPSSPGPSSDRRA